MKIIFIRHGKTLGNVNKKYIGITDEPLCDDCICELFAREYPSAECIVSSPMRRCVQTAEIIYLSQKYSVYNDLRECDFGDFEGKNYVELSGNPEYHKWVESNGELPFPNGEKHENFKKRCCDDFEKATAEHAECQSIAFVVHGGTIMAILEKFAVPKRKFYDYQVKNGCGYITDYNAEAKEISIIKEIK